MSVKKYHWSWTAAWAAGVIMLIWIIVETFSSVTSALQPVITVGVSQLLLTLLPMCADIILRPDNRYI